MGITEPEPETYDERKAQYDRERVRLRLDAPAWLKAEIEKEAKSRQMSISNLAGFLLAYALTLYRDGDPELLAALEAATTEITSLRWSYAVVLDDLAAALTEPPDA